MKFLPVTLFIIFFSAATVAQNALVQMFHPQYHEWIPLVTDSLYISVQQGETLSLSRSIHFDHLEGLPESWGEVYSQENPPRILKKIQFSEAIANGFLTYSYTIDSISNDTLKSRTTIQGPGVNRPDSIMYEIWSSGVWKPQQKTLYAYIGTQLLGRQTEMEWDGSQEDWVGKSRTNFSYDAQKRTTAKEDQIWKDDIWESQNIQRYSYSSGAVKPKYSLWHSAGTPVDSVYTWYDNEGLEDSSKVYQWSVFHGSWILKSRRILGTNQAKLAQNGNVFIPNTGGAVMGDWIPKESRLFVVGEGLFTDEPREELLRIYNPVSEEWQDTWRRTIEYTPLPDGRIYGKVRISEFSEDDNWNETFTAEGWFHLAPDSLNGSTPKDRTEPFTYSNKCGFYNPYIQNQTVTFPAADVVGDYDLRIFGEDGRLVFQQRYDQSGQATVSASLLPSVYIVSVRKGGVQLCAQKLIVH